MSERSVISAFRYQRRRLRALAPSDRHNEEVSPPRRIRDLVGRHPTLAHVSTLLTGTVLAQIIVLATTPIIARLYSPADIGAFASMLAIAQTVGAVAGLRYDMAIVLPERDDEARRLMRVVLACAAAAAILTSLVCAIAATRIAGWLHHPNIAPYLGWSGVLVGATAIINACGYWLTRARNYSAIASNRVHQTIGVEGSRIALPLLGIGALSGQVASQAFGQSVSAALLLFKSRSALRAPGASGLSTRQLLVRYRRMPLLTLPNALVDAVRVNGITILVGVYFSADPQGQFAKAWLLMQAPVALVTSAVSQVFYERFARAERGGMRPLVVRSVLMSAAAGVLPFLVLAVVAPALFPWYLGAQWDVSGVIAQALVPWLFLNVITSPISTVFVVTDRQAVMLAFALVYAIVPLALIARLGSTGESIVTTMWAVSGAMTILLILLVVVTIWVASRWDHADGASSSAGVGAP